MKLKPILLGLVALIFILGANCIGRFQGQQPPKPALAPQMQEILAGSYDVQMQFAGQDQTVQLAITNNRAAFVKTSSEKLDGLSGQFELIGNGVFMARLAGKNHRATQWWIFNPDGTVTIKEIPDRGEKQMARPTQ